MSKHRRRVQLPWLAAGFTVWALGFVVIYSAVSLGCAYGWHTVTIGPISLQRAILIGLTLLTTLAAAGVAIKLGNARREGQTVSGQAAFTSVVAYHAALAATTATAITFVGIPFLSTC